MAEGCRRQGKMNCQLIHIDGMRQRIDQSGNHRTQEQLIVKIDLQIIPMEDRSQDYEQREEGE